MGRPGAWQRGAVLRRVWRLGAGRRRCYGNLCAQFDHHNDWGQTGRAGGWKGLAATARRCPLRCSPRRSIEAPRPGSKHTLRRGRCTRTKSSKRCMRSVLCFGAGAAVTRQGPCSTLLPRACADTARPQPVCAGVLVNAPSGALPRRLLTRRGLNIALGAPALLPVARGPAARPLAVLRTVASEHSCRKARLPLPAAARPALGQGGLQSLIVCPRAHQGDPLELAAAAWSPAHGIRAPSTWRFRVAPLTPPAGGQASVGPTTKLCRLVVRPLLLFIKETSRALVHSTSCAAAPVSGPRGPAPPLAGHSCKSGG